MNVKINAEKQGQGTASEKIVYSILIDYRSGEGNLVDRLMDERAGFKGLRTWTWETSGLFPCRDAQHAIFAYKEAKKIMKEINEEFAAKIAAQEQERIETLSACLAEKLLEMYEAGKLYTNGQGGLKKLSL